ncbi:MAG: hypothetical protein AB8G95_09605 [Anaerolineae bacterium]
MALSFGDLLSNALHDIKQQTGKKISILQDEVGYAFDPVLSGDTIEKWRYRKTLLSAVQLASLAEALISYQHPNHNREWLFSFLEKGGDPYPEATCERLFPTAQEAVEETTAAREIDLSTAPDLAAYRPPASSGFIGRTQELDHYKNQLGSRKLTAICGMAGMGKTSLATEIAHAVDIQTAVFWHRFYDQNLNTLIRRLAGFLTHFGKSDLWEMIESARLAGVRPPDVTTCFDTLATQLSGLDLLLCFDDLQFADSSQELVDFLRRLIEPNQDGKNPAILITSRRFPSFLPADLRSELSGLSSTDTAQLLTERGLSLSADLLAELHKVTEGNGAFLTLAAVVLQEAQDPADLIERLATIEDIERFLLEEVNDRLSGQEQRAMEGIAVLSGYPGSRDVLEVMLNQRDVRRTLRTLADQHLLATSEGENGREFSQHQIIQTFYYEQPSRQKKRDMHRHAAEFYELEEVDRFKAVLHYAKAGEADRAVQLTAEHLWEIVNQGMASSLLPILESIKAEGLAEDERFELWLVQGQLDTLMGDYENAEDVLKQAAEALNDSEVSPRNDVLKARVCLHMTELLARQSPQDALEWAQRGLEIVPHGESNLTAALTIQSGTMMMHMGNFGGALETFDVVEPAVLDQDKTLLLDYWLNLTSINMHLSQHRQALEYSKTAVRLSKERREHVKTSRILSNQAYIFYMLGEWNNAINKLEESLGIAKRLGSVNDVLDLSVNLGRLYSDLGNHELAWQHLEHALKASGTKSSRVTMATRLNMGRLLIEEKQFMQADDHLQLALAEAKQQNDQVHIYTIHMHQAESFIKQGNIEHATDLIGKSIENFNQLGDNHSLGICLRVRAELQISNGDLLPAKEDLEQSLTLLKNVDIFQEAVSIGILGKLNLANGDEEIGLSQLKESFSLFQKIGAAGKQAWIQGILVAQNKV